MLVSAVPSAVVVGSSLFRVGACQEDGPDEGEFAMAKIAAMGRTRQVTKAPDGRTLTFAEWGDLAGVPVFALHGTPGCRLNRHPNAALVRSTGAWVISYDRPGYGGSDRPLTAPAHAGPASPASSPPPSGYLIPLRYRSPWQPSAELVTLAVKDR